MRWPNLSPTTQSIIQSSLRSVPYGVEGKLQSSAALAVMTQLTCSKIDFGSFLESRADFEQRKSVYYHEIRTICSLPRHPNIIPSPNVLVTTRKIKDDQRAYVCGALYPFMQHGTLDDQVQRISGTATRLPLIDKARWCFQMASAIAHTHFAAHKFHMDIKPANFVVNANKDLTLIDWEQSGA